VVNGRFKGGYVTRHYGRPDEHVHALQLEMAQSAYMDEAPPYAWDAARASPLATLLERLVEALSGWRRREPPEAVAMLVDPAGRAIASRRIWCAIDCSSTASRRTCSTSTRRASSGDVPPDVAMPQVWLDDDDDKPRALAVLRDYYAAGNAMVTVLS
jgi:hypothetical protein